MPDPDDIPLHGPFAGDGEARARARAVDWRATPLGAPAAWPEALRTAVRLALGCRTPIAIWAGPELTLVHNDAYARVLGSKADSAMGRPARDVWQEVWPELRPQFVRILEGGPALRLEDAPFAIARDGATETAFFTYSLTRLDDEAGRPLAVFNVCEETTSRVRALEASRDFASYALATAGLGAWEVDLATGAVQRSVDHDRIFGYDEPVRDWTYATFLAHVVPEDRDAVALAYGEAVERRGSLAIELRIRTAKGEVRRLWCAGRHRPLGAAGRPSFAGITQDVTDRRQADEVRREDRRRLRWVLDTTGIGLWLNTLPLGALNWDARTRELFFVPPGVEPTAELFWSRLHPDDREPTRVAVEAAIRDHTLYQIDHRVVHPGTGELRWVRSAGQATYGPGGEPIRFDGINYDVTDRKRTEEELRRVASAFAAVSESTPVVVAVKDRGSRIVLANPATIALVGRPADEVYGHDDVDWFGPEIGGPIVENDRRVMASGRTQTIEEVTPGGRVWLSTKTPWRSEAGEILGVIVVSHDITERKRLEEELREADRQKTRFLAVLSHELRNPLAPIRNALALLDRAPPGGEVERRAKETLHRQSEHLVRLVDDLLDLSRITHDKLVLELAVHDARALVREAWVDAKGLFDARGIHLALAAPAEPVWIRADAARLAQLVGNLLQNALKFTPRGGHVRLAVTARDGACELTVKDDGPGLSPEDLQRVFDPFEQALRAKDAPAGLGLGLALVRRLAELHRGSAEARSDGPGRGAEFVVRLPLSAPPPGAPASAASAAPAGAGALSVLVVEDNEDAATTLAEILELDGHRVRIAATGRAAISAAAAERPEVVVCDLGLPDMTGLDVIRALRAAESGDRTFAIALTGYAQPHDREAALAAGFDAHLSKPPRLEALQELLAEARRRAAGGEPPPA